MPPRERAALLSPRAVALLTPSDAAPNATTRRALFVAQLRLERVNLVLNQVSE
jgi:hypothetical protein